MNSTRRDFIRLIVAGSVAAGCPFDFSLLAVPPQQSNTGEKAEVDGEHYEICHKVRDQAPFPHPPVSARHDLVIVGGGISGLASAYYLQKYDFLLLEKEEHLGGNAYLESFQGQDFATGAAFDWTGSHSAALSAELGLKMLPIDDPDPAIINGAWVPQMWRAGLDQLPYPPAVRESFKKFKRDILSINVKQHPEQYDNQPFTKYLEGYAPEIQRFWDAYGPSNWGAKPAETSALLAIQEFHDVAGDDPDTRITLPGGNGAISRRLAEVLSKQHKEQLLQNATTIAIEQQRSEVHVTYVHGSELKTVAARAVIMATPKFITARLVSHLPDAQQEAMLGIRYIPYPVINMIFSKPVYERGYDTWCPGNSFTDFIVADWTVRNQPGYHRKNNILTFYTPLDEGERAKLLQVDSCRRVAARVLRDFQKLLPEFAVNPVEIHLYRRGHPMFMSAPGVFTKLIPAASRPLERIFFANTDSLGPESTSSGAVAMAQRAAEWTEKLLARKAAANLFSTDLGQPA